MILPAEEPDVAPELAIVPRNAKHGASSSKNEKLKGKSRMAAGETSAQPK